MSDLLAIVGPAEYPAVGRDRAP